MEQMRKILLIFARILPALNLFKTCKKLKFSLLLGVLSLSKPFLSKMRLIGALMFGDYHKFSCFVILSLLQKGDPTGCKAQAVAKKSKEI